MEFDLYALGPALRDVPEIAAEAAKVGASALWLTESAHNAFVSCAPIAVSTHELLFGTNVAVAFARSPMVTAQAAWDLVQASDGRFVLGLGSQVKAHVVRRFAMPFSNPAARLREYVCALRAIWAAFNQEAPLKFDGEFYSFSLLTDFFSPGPAAHPHVPVFLAGVNRGMARVAGEVGDGFHAHPLHSVRYLREVVRPTIDMSAVNAGRSPTDVQLAVPVFIAVGSDEEQVMARREAIRRQIGFYGSTPSYRAVFDLHGWDDVAESLQAAQRRRDEDAVRAAVSDDVVDAMSVTADWDSLADTLLRRYAGLADRLFPYGLVAWSDPAERERWSDVSASIRRAKDRAST
jgi:probable F420-dependent oxidoreductase